MSEGASAATFESRPLQAAAAPGTAPCVIFDSHHPKHYLTVRALAARCRAFGVEVVWTCLLYTSDAADD